eukprot:CAMPEP_0172677790 /NCGR_PEP_ID=MMETSP1074-20121228/14925_1 /TAXON_ID=2916 /ORGANISM="Ceratium fusus, Strain PA161109" /LENGTH=80 /DNA_ID=CAMNT_0013495691 /DNA_START=10 /DNA_END=249 /DNA_ORIENTATION=+
MSGPSSLIWGNASPAATGFPSLQKFSHSITGITHATVHGQAFGHNFAVIHGSDRISVATHATLRVIGGGSFGASNSEAHR